VPLTETDTTAHSYTTNQGVKELGCAHCSIHCWNSGYGSVGFNLHYCGSKDHQ